MDNEKLNKKEVQEEIKKIFSSNPSSKQIRKVKKLAMSKNIKLGKLRKKFCKKCSSLFDSNNSETRIKKRFKIIKCKNCNYLTKYKLKS